MSTLIGVCVLCGGAVNSSSDYEIDENFELVHKNCDDIQPQTLVTKSANQRMIGGDHYKNGEGEEHWDRVWRLYGRGYFVGCITKYVERYHRKNGIEDLEKAQHFLEKLIELEKAKKVKDESERVSKVSTENAMPTGSDCRSNPT